MVVGYRCGDYATKASRRRGEERRAKEIERRDEEPVPDKTRVRDESTAAT